MQLSPTHYSKHTHKTHKTHKTHRVPPQRVSEENDDDLRSLRLVEFWKFIIAEEMRKPPSPSVSPYPSFADPLAVALRILPSFVKSKTLFETSYDGLADCSVSLIASRRGPGHGFAIELLSHLLHIWPRLDSKREMLFLRWIGRILPHIPGDVANAMTAVPVPSSADSHSPALSGKGAASEDTDTTTAKTKGGIGPLRRERRDETAQIATTFRKHREAQSLRADNGTAALRRLHVDFTRRIAAAVRSPHAQVASEVSLETPSEASPTVYLSSS